MSRFRHSGIWLFLALALLLAGCGSSERDFVLTPSGQGRDGQVATVQLQSVLAQTAIPSEVDSLRATGFDDDLTLWFGPVSQDKAALVEWADVPVEVTDFVIEYLADGQVVGIAQVAVQLVSGQTFTIENPTILEVTAPLQSLTLTPPSRTIAAGTSAAFTATGLFADGSTLDLTSSVTWTSSQTAVASVTQGVVQGLSPGTATLTASFAGLSGQATLTVSDATLVSIEVSPESPAIANGTNQQFEAEGFFSDGSFQDVTDDVTWNSSLPSVATIEDGLAQGLQAGQTTITATLQDKSAGTVLTVTSATLQSLAVGGGLPSIAAGTSTEFTATGTFSDQSTQDLTSSAAWTSSNPNVASVVKGRAQGLSSGTVTLTASFAGINGTSTLAVTDAVVTELEVEADGGTLVGLNQTITLRAVATFSDDSSQNVTVDAVWVSDNEGVATVVQGVVTGVSPGQAEIEGTFGGRSGSMLVTVQDAPLPALVLSGQSYTFDTDTGLLSPQVGSSPTAPGWNATESRLVLDSFTLEAGANVTVTGSLAFRVKTDNDLTIAGTIDRSGVAGVDGVGGAPGGSGADGGNVNLFAGGNLTVTETGRVLTPGGTGGAGESLFPSANLFNVEIEAGDGGSGGRGGAIVLTAGEGLAVAGTLDATGGAGGNGGQISSSFVLTTQSVLAVATGGDGGQGGQGGQIGLSAGLDLSHSGAVLAQGGSGGAGGQVVFLQFSSSRGFAGDGGSGGQGGIMTVVAGGSLMIPGELQASGGYGGAAGGVVASDPNNTGSGSNLTGGVGGAGGNAGSVSSAAVDEIGFTGTLLGAGGAGGAGGAVGAPDLTDVRLTGGNGGDAGRGAAVSWTAASTQVLTGTAQLDGGTGGAGGDATGDDELFNSRVTGGDGGRGGDGGTPGGQGGDGGIGGVASSNGGTNTNGAAGSAGSP